MMTLAELYVQGSARLAVRDSLFFDVFFEVCPVEEYTLESLPELCDLRDPVAGCLTAGHAPVTYASAPPTTPFRLEITSSRVFSWAVSTYAGSAVHLRHIGPRANLAIGVGGCTTTYSFVWRPERRPSRRGSQTASSSSTRLWRPSLLRRAQLGPSLLRTAARLHSTTRSLGSHPPSAARVLTTCAHEGSRGGTAGARGVARSDSQARSALGPGRAPAAPLREDRNPVCVEDRKQRLPGDFNGAKPRT